MNFPRNFSEGTIPTIFNRVVSPTEEFFGKKEKERKKEVEGRWKPAEIFQHRMNSFEIRKDRKFTNLPGNNLAISAHRFPTTLCASNMIWSSSSVHEIFDKLGSKSFDSKTFRDGGGKGQNRIRLNQNTQKERKRVRKKERGYQREGNKLRRGKETNDYASVHDTVFRFSPRNAQQFDSIFSFHGSRQVVSTRYLR